MYNLRKIFMILLYCVVYFSSHFYDFILMCSVIFIAHLSARICRRVFVGAHLSVAILSGHAGKCSEQTLIFLLLDLNCDG
jgi:hypothetical protein